MVLSGVGNAATDIQTSCIALSGNYASGVNEYKSMPNDQNIIGNYTLHASYHFQAYYRWDGSYDSFKSTIQPAAGTQACDGNNNCGGGTYAVCAFFARWGSTPHAITANGNGYMNGVCDASSFACLFMSLSDTPGTTQPVAHGYIKAYVIYTDGYIYSISGATDCLDNVSLYYNNSGSWTYMSEDHLTVDDYYSFNVTTGEDFKLIFNDGHSYEFNVTCDSVYNYDGCVKTYYRFEESCENLIPDSEGVYWEFYPAIPENSYNFYAPSGILDISNSSANKFTVYTNTFIGSYGWVIDPVTTDTIYTLENPIIDWGLKVIVQNESDDTLIDGAMVKVDQGCYCTDDYSTRQKLTVNGMSQFGDMSLQDASLFVQKTGYKILDENTTGYSTFLSGRSNFSSKTWIVKLANSSSNNSSTFYEVNNTVDIHFVDVTGNRTSKILDTDATVDLYYENNNTEKEAMTLKFQSSSTHTYFIDEQTWTIPYDAIGHKTIANSYFTPWDYSYRAVIYNSSIYGWNMTIPLTVRNGTREEEQHYQNLTTNLWFLYASDGKVDYRNDMKVAIHARSNNTTLMTTDIELWKNGVYIACKNLTATDFINADFPYYYVWDPVFDYITGSNYSVRMYGFDRTLLETDYVQCISDDTTRKNKLTIGVKDRAGNNLNNAYIYLEDWGLLPTGSVYYNSYEGIDDGDYRYKASKSGYSSSGWESVNLTDEDKIVWYVLSCDTANTSVSVQKFTDEDIQGFFFPLMYFLFICIILGGLKYVTQ